MLDSTPRQIYFDNLKTDKYIYFKKCDKCHFFAKFYFLILAI